MCLKKKHLNVECKNFVSKHCCEIMNAIYKEKQYILMIVCVFNIKMFINNNNINNNNNIYLM